jgi:hypothetical protein
MEVQVSRYYHSLSSCIFALLFAVLSLSCAGPGPYPKAPGLTVHTPNERTFYIPSDVEPLQIVISFPAGISDATPIVDIELLDAKGKVVFRRGGRPTPGSPVKIGTQSGQIQTLSPTGVVPGWYTVKVYGEKIWGTSGQFRISGLGPLDDHSITVSFPADTVIRPGKKIRLSWKAWGHSCNPARGYTVMLFRNGSHGVSHSQWILDMKATGSRGAFRLPADIPASGTYFVMVDNGKFCDGTSSPIPLGEHPPGGQPPGDQPPGDQPPGDQPPPSEGIQ